MFVSLGIKKYACSVKFETSLGPNQNITVMLQEVTNGSLP